MYFYSFLYFRVNCRGKQFPIALFLFGPSYCFVSVKQKPNCLLFKFHIKYWQTFFYYLKVQSIYHPVAYIKISKKKKKKPKSWAQNKYDNQRIMQV